MISDSPITVKQLKEFLEGWPEEDELGNPILVWLESDLGENRPLTVMNRINEPEAQPDLILSAGLITEAETDNWRML
jgi:hypothetical protein